MHTLTTPHNMARRETPFIPQTPFQTWLHEAMRRRGFDIADLARAAGTDYPHLWKIAKGDPLKYPTSRRPGYELTKAIGVALHDVDGALDAAGYEKSAAGPIDVAGDLVKLKEGDRFVVEATTGDQPPTEILITPEVMSVLVALADALAPAKETEAKPS